MVVTNDQMRRMYSNIKYSNYPHRELHMIKMLVC